METSYENIIYSVKRRANIITREELQFIGCDEAKHVETNMGNMPLEDYYDIVAMQHGYDSYDDMKKDGLIIAPPEIVEDKGIL